MNINLKIVVFVLTLAASAFAVVLGIAVGSGEYLTPSLIAATFGALFLICNPHFAAGAAVANYFSALTLPDLPGQMRLFDVLVLVLVAIFLLQAVMHRQKRMPFSWLDWAVICLSSWILFIGFYRGFGFLFLGGGMMGGYAYPRLLFCAVLVIVLPRVGITERRWNVTFLFLGLLAPTALLSDLIISHGGRAFDFVQLVLQPSVNLHQMQDTVDGSAGGGLQRIWAAGPAAGGMLLSMLCLVPMRRFFQISGIHWLLLFALITCLSLVSGFRLMTASIFLVSALTLFFQKGFTAPRMVVLAIAGCVGLASLYLFATSLPLSVQRAVSWLPYIDVNASASDDASGTIDWRFRLWREALRDLPEYWMIGKGFSYDKGRYIAAMLSNDDLRWALLTGSYHNGWLSMLLCTGILGTLLCLLVMVGSVTRHWKRQFSPWHNPQLKRYHGVFLAGLVAQVGIFLVFYGDVHVSFPSIFFHLAILESLSATDVNSTHRISEEPEETSDYAESTYHV